MASRKRQCTKAAGALLAAAVGLASPLAVSAGSARSSAHSAHQAAALTPFERAQRQREALEGRPEQQRTRRDYERVLDAYRAIYHGDPASPKADASVYAVAELLAQEGRLFQDNHLLDNAIGQYEFLRREYPSTRYRFSALLTEGEIYRRDFGQRDAARAIFQQFVKLYPQNSLAEQARQELAEMHAEDVRRGKRGGPTVASRGSGARGVKTAGAAAPAVAGSGSAHRNTVLTAAMQSQQEEQRRAASSEAAAEPTHSSPVFVPPPAPSQPPAAAQAEAPAASSRMEPAPQYGLTEAQLNAPPPPRRGRVPLVTGIRHWSTPVYTRVAIDLEGEVQFEASRVPNPDRIFFDLHGARLSPELIGKSVEVTDGGFLKRVRAAQFPNDLTRIVLDVSDVSEYSAFLLPNPARLIIDIHGTRPGLRAPVQVAGNTTSQAGSARQQGATYPQPVLSQNSYTPSQPYTAAPGAAGSAQRPAAAPGRAADSSLSESDIPSSPYGAPAPTRSAAAAPPRTTTAAANPDARYVGQPRPRSTQPSRAVTRAATPAAVPPAGPPAAEPTTPAYTATNRQATGSATRKPSAATNLQDIASLDQQPNRVKATKRPSTAPVVASVAGTTPAPQPDDTVASTTPPAVGARRARSAASPIGGVAPADPAIHAASPTADGQRSLVRALGLKIGRIVVDAGHGGHDSGTLGPGGLEEKDVVLDVALRLGKLLKQRLGADVIYTRDDDTFIPLETRTAIANKAQADLFISVHANSSSDSSARGVETYYLNFTSSPDALEVAARENAVSNQSIHQLSDLVKKIALTEKINESREFAADVQTDLYSGLEKGNSGLKDRGVKKAPFVVLIGANMPSILAEISFLTNPDDAHELRDPNYRERIAESLYRGVAKYVGGLSGVRLAQSGGN
jgi:N-acetylmuramoyl-L-alanine amidase